MLLKIVAGLGIFYVVKRICAIGSGSDFAFILYKKRHGLQVDYAIFKKAEIRMD